MSTIIIVGGLAGGTSAAARLRRLDETAEIIMFERGEFISSDNCGLPYYIGGEIKEAANVIRQTPQIFHDYFRVDVRILQDVTEINRNEKTVTVRDLKTGGSYRESYDKMILSPGAAPIVPPLEGARGNRVFTLRNIPDTKKIKEFIDREQPKSAVVAGGGYIGVEMAENLKKAGLDVTIVEMTNQVIAPLDYDMACDVHRYLKQNGIRLILGDEVKNIRERDGHLGIALNSSELDADMLIMAVGVRPENKLAKTASLAMNERGAIAVNEHMLTSDENIYAVGDAVEIVDFVSGQKAVIPLAGPASKQGRIAADNICGIPSAYRGTQGSAILKVFDMTIAATGINEKKAKRLGLDYDKSFTFSSSHAGYFPGAVDMSIKTLYDRKTGRILGAQIVGYSGVDKRCDVLAAAIRAGMTASELAELELCYAPPYSSANDPVNIAGFVIENLLTGKVKHVHWHDVDALRKDPGVTLLDIRIALEYENGHIEGFINIPLEELRDRITELDKTKKICVTCQFGLRGYIAARILTQNGFDAYNLSGGYSLYNSIYGKKAVPDFDVEPAGNQTGEDSGKTIKIDACGLQCPGPVMKLAAAVKEAGAGEIIEISTTDPAFAGDIEGFCSRTGHQFLGITSEKGVNTARLKVAGGQTVGAVSSGNGKNIIVFSGDLDKAIACFIIANASAALGRKVSMFFTFWGLNILRKPEKVTVKKDFLSKMFCTMMPRGSQKLGLSKMNMGGMGPKMIRMIMKNKNVDSLEALIGMAQQNGVELVACSMSMDVMGIKQEELIDGVQIGGAAAMLAHAEESDMSLFI